MPLVGPPDKGSRVICQHVRSFEEEIKDIIVSLSNLHADLPSLSSSGGISLLFSFEDVLFGFPCRNSTRLVISTEPMKSSMLQRASLRWKINLPDPCSRYLRVQTISGTLNAVQPNWLGDGQGGSQKG